jgi:ABC-type polysaccharide/polyol phosphate export permease
MAETNRKVASGMSEAAFAPPISFAGQNLVFLLMTVIAFGTVVAFFLYENLQHRGLQIELALAVVAAFTLGIAIFFALIRADFRL